MDSWALRGSGFLLVLLLGTAASLENHNFNLTTSSTIQYAIGGTRVTFSGLQLANETNTIQCVFHSADGGGSIKDEAVVSYDKQHVTCRIPANVGAGKVQVDLEVSDPEGTGLTQVFTQSSFIIPEPRLEVAVEEDWANKQIKFTWNSDYFEALYPPGTPIYLEAAIYMSDGGTPTFSPTTVRIPIDFNNVGTKTAPLSDAMYQSISTFVYPYFYQLRQPGTQSQIYQTSGLFTPTLEKVESVAKEICSAWLLDATGPPAEAEIEHCPNCHCKAKIDKNFIKAEFDPQILKLTEGQLANHELYYQRVPTASGHAQSCSYNVGTNALATSSPATAAWHNYVSKDISYVENYLSDIWPYIVCCLQTKDGQFCDAFHQRRPIDTGHNYTGPDDPCQGTGDPHMITFDGVRYDFMGYGEFWLIHPPAGADSSKFGVQGRMSPLTETQKVSYYRAVVLRDGETTVQIQHDDQGSIQIVLNGADLLTIPQTPTTLPLGNASISINGASVEVRLRTGFTIKVDSARTYFNVYGSGALSNKGEGYMGIFGMFDGDPENDFTTRSGTVIPPTAENIRNLSLLHNVFGLSWMTTAEESFFTYEDGKSWENYTKLDFGPILAYPDPADMSDEVRAICRDNLACYYEYVGTGDLKDAEDAVAADDQFEELKDEIAEEILLCGQLGSPVNGRVNVEGYLNGSLARYSCIEEYELAGDSARMCAETENGVDWNGEEPVCNWTCGLCTEDIDYQLSHDPSDCTKYFLCTMGVRIFLVCPPGESFNREFSVCEKDYECNDPPGC